MREIPLVLKVDMGGRPSKWITYQHSAYYYSKEAVAWAMGEEEIILTGGISRMTGVETKLIMSTIVAIKGFIIKGDTKDHIPSLNNKTLFRRDQKMCGYCGDLFHDRELTRDHIKPKAQGGRDIWTNVVTSCYNCNNRKSDRTPEQARMELLYVPYAPNKAEALILENRRILSNQMEFLITQVPKHSRLFN